MWRCGDPWVAWHDHRNDWIAGRTEVGPSPGRHGGRIAGTEETAMKCRTGVQIVGDPRVAKVGDLIGYWRGDRPIYLQGGGAEDDDDDDGDDGDGGLLGGDDDDQDDDGDDGDDGDGDDGDGDDEELTPAQVKAIEKHANRIADKRINQILKDRREKRPARRTGNRRDDADKGDQGNKGVASADLREARAVYREFVGGEIKFLGPEEQKIAAELAKTMLPSMLASGMDVDEAGEKVAEDVAARLKEIRGLYERETVKVLKQRGALPKDWKPGQPRRGPKVVGPTSNWKSGEERAKAMFADRLPAATN